MKFRKKPVVIEALQYTSKEDGLRIIAWTQGTTTPAFLADHVPSDGAGFGMTLRVRTLESGGGSHVVAPGDWVIRGVSGEHYPCKPDIFQATYEPVCDGTYTGDHESGCAVPAGPSTRRPCETDLPTL